MYLPVEWTGDYGHFQVQWAVRSTVSGGKVEWKWQSQKLKELKHSEPWMLVYGLVGAGEEQRLG